MSRVSGVPELKEKYSRWLRPEIISVRIIQKNHTVFLEVATKTEHQTLADEAVKRTDLEFISEDTDLGSIEYNKRS